MVVTHFSHEQHQGLLLMFTRFSLSWNICSWGILSQSYILTFNLFVCLKPVWENVLSLLWNTEDAWNKLIPFECVDKVCFLMCQKQIFFWICGEKLSVFKEWAHPSTRSHGRPLKERHIFLPVEVACSFWHLNNACIWKSPIYESKVMPFWPQFKDTVTRNVLYWNNFATL